MQKVGELLWLCYVVVGLSKNPKLLLFHPLLIIGSPEKNKPLLNKRSESETWHNQFKVLKF